MHEHQPIQQRIRPEAAPSPAPSVRRPARRPRVLLIDDEKHLLQACRLVMHPHFEMVVCARADQALALLDEVPEFDAIVCDLMMQEMDGEQFYRQICMNRPDLACRVLIMTAGVPCPRSPEFARHLTHLLQKPFSTEGFRTAVEELLRRVQ